MLKKESNSLSLKFVLFVLPLIGAAVVVTAVVLTVHHYRFYNPPPSQFETLLLHTLFLVLLITILLCSAAGVLGWFWISRQLRPIRILQEHIRHIGQGIFDQRVDIKSPREIRTLAGSLNHMAASLKQHVRDETEAARNAVRQETEAVQGTATRKIMHEMGNFLNNIDLVVYGLKPENLSPRGQKIMKILIDESGRIKRFLRRFLRFSRKPELRLQPCRLEAILADVIAELEPEAREADIRIEAQHPAAAPLVQVDAGQIHTVLQNLLRNSMEAIGRSGVIRIETGTEGPHFRIEVADSGSGMDAETLRRAFEPFFTTKQTGDGAGLGLAICRTIVEAHGGAISCGNAPGGGATFLIRLPLSENPAS